MNYIYGREAFPNEKVVPLSDVEPLLKELGDNALLKHEAIAIQAELDKFRTFDKEFPLVMRVKGLVEHAAALAALVNRLENEKESLQKEKDRLLKEIHGV